MSRNQWISHTEYSDWRDFPNTFRHGDQLEVSPNKIMPRDMIAGRTGS